MSRPVLLDLFSGIGGFSLAFERAGFGVVAHSEIEPFPSKVLAHHWPAVPNLGDVCGIDGTKYDVDVVSFGSPCQDLSVAGKRAGLSGERSGLFHEAVRIVRESGARFALWENVPGAFSSNGGWDFAAVLDALADGGALDIAWCCLDAQWFGVPQRRRRIFLIADFGGERAGEILSIPSGLSGDTPPRREEGKDAAGGSGGGAAVALRNGARDADTRPGRSGVGLAEETSFALQAEQHHAVIQPIPRVASTLGGGSGSRGWADDTDRMTFVPEVAGGNPARYGKGADSDVTDTVIPEPIAFDWQSGGDVRHNVTSDGDPSLQSSQTPAVTVPPVLTTNGESINTTGYQGDRVIHSGDTWSSLQAQNCNNGGGAGVGLLHRTAVRRLTPRECERLQGYPDSWTNIPGAADGPRYRALGNSVAVPVVEWISHRIAAALKEDA